MDKTRLAAQSKHNQALTDVSLPANGYNILQLDGNAFHTFTKGFVRPFDDRFIAAMNKVAVELVQNIPTSRFAFVQSDEISIFMQPDAESGEQPFFNNRLQKVVSLSAARASVVMSSAYPEKGMAMFDARFFNVPDAQTAIEHFIWRQRDCTKNSILSVGQSVFSHKELQGKNTLEVREMLNAISQPWESYATEYKHGRVIKKVPHDRDVTFVHKRTGKEETVLAKGFRWEALPAERFEESRLLDEYIR
jgi:tRNA(His) guanylyltransferase